MKIVLQHDRCVLFHGDSATPVLGEHTVDAIVTDPPAGIGFMAKEWDGDKGGRDAWVKWLAETLAPSFRALKPGGHALVWALPRTSHWTALALELAGFEIRDRVSHFFGTGFPKSLNVSKAIDGHLGAHRRPGGVSNTNCSFLNRGEPCQGHAADERSQAGLMIHSAPTVAGSPEAAAWEGWGTALKPACEDWWLARKPLVGTVAANVLAHGTGGINIDGCRIEGIKDVPASPKIVGASLHTVSLPGNQGTSGWDPSVGRWPAHVTFDPEAAAILDAQAGPSVSRKGKSRRSAKPGEGYGMTATGAEYNDAGGPSRFYFVAKPSSRERDLGCDGLPPRTGGEATDREDGSAGVANPRAGAGRGGGRRNFHPTVKSTELMRWLVRLITPVGGTVLDPFCGSGSTGVAALAEAMNFVGIEREEEYMTIAKARLEHALKEPK